MTKKNKKLITCMYTQKSDGLKIRCIIFHSYKLSPYLHFLLRYNCIVQKSVLHFSPMLRFLSQNAKKSSNPMNVNSQKSLVFCKFFFLISFTYQTNVSPTFSQKLQFLSKNTSNYLHVYEPHKTCTLFNTDFISSFINGLHGLH